MTSERLEFDLLVKQNNLYKALAESSKKASELGDVLTVALGVFAGEVAKGAFTSIVSGFNSIIDIGKESISAAAQQEVAINNLNNALARSGNYTKKASEDLQEYATALQATTIYEDDAVLSAASFLESLTNLDTNGLKKATKATADLATVLNIDLQSAASILAKSIEGNTVALSRYGITVAKGKTESERLNNVLTALSSKVNGAAASQLNTYTGSVLSLSNSYSELKESIGNVVVTNPLVIAGINEFKKALLDTANGVSALKPEMQDLLNNGFFAISSGAQVLSDIFDGFTIVAKVLIGSFQNVGAAILSYIIYPIEQAIDGLINLSSRIPVIGDAISGLENPLSGATKSLQDFATDGLDTVLKAFDPNTFTAITAGINNYTNKTIDSAAVIAASDKVKNQDRVANEKAVSEEILKERNKLGADILILQGQLAGEEKAFKDQMAALSIADESAQNEARIVSISEQKMLEAQAIYNGELLKNKTIADSKQKELADEKAYQQFYLSTKKAFDEKELALTKNKVDQTKKLNKEKEADQRDTFSTIANMSNDSNKTLAAIGKAAALTQIAIDTPVAIGKALSAFPPPFNYAAATAVGVAMAAQAARVAGVKFEDGGFIGGANGATSGKDNRVAQVRDGEMVLNASQQKNLMDMINSGGNGGDIIIQVDGREIARAVRTQVLQGYKLA